MKTTASPRLADPQERLASRLLPPAEVRELSRLDPAAGLLHTGLEWALILGAATLAWRFFHPATCVLAIAFIGARQHALLLLMHESMHHKLLPNRRLNDWVGEAIMWAFPLPRMRGQRRNHISHHRNVNTPADPDWLRKHKTPDWAFPMGRLALLRVLALAFVGVGFVRAVLEMKRVERFGVVVRANEQDERAMIVACAVFRAAALVAVVLAGLAVPVLLFWVVPLLTWLPLVKRVNAIAEHFGIEGREGPYAETRTTLTTWFGRMIVAPKSFGYHYEHHLYPSVPFYRLAALHRRLMTLPEYRRSVHLTHGYWNVLRECTHSGALRPGGARSVQRLEL